LITENGLCPRKFGEDGGDHRKLAFFGGVVLGSVVAGDKSEQGCDENGAGQRINFFHFYPFGDVGIFVENCLLCCCSALKINLAVIFFVKQALSGAVR
jgi:hypothetical protein